MKEYLDSIVAFIAEHNRYYSGGQWVLPEDVKNVFPDDTRGDHFIVLLGADMRISNRIAARVDACLTPAVMEGSADVIGMIRGADRFAMLENIIYTLQALGVKINSSTIGEEAVIDKVIKGREERDAAKARVGDYSMVSVNFTTNYIITPKQLSCITSPCSC